MYYYDIDPNGRLGLTIKAVGNQAVKYVSFGAIDGLYKTESPGGLGGYYTDGGTAISASSSDNNNKASVFFEIFKETSEYNEFKREVNRLGYLLTLLGEGAFFMGRIYGPEPTVLQSGKRKVTQDTANKLNENFGTNIHRRDWGRALENMKTKLRVRGDHHGKILSNGDYRDNLGKVVGNIAHYLP